MSMGFGFRAKLEESDGKVAAYSYRTYDLSCEEGRQGVWSCRAGWRLMGRQ